MAAFPLMHASDERRHAVPVRRAHVGACGEQPIHQIQIVMVRRPVESRRAVGLSGIDLGALFDQLTNGGTVHPLHRARKRRIRLRAAHFGGQVRSVRSEMTRERENDQQMRFMFILIPTDQPA